MAKRAINEDRDAEFTRDWESKTPIKDLALKYGVDGSTISTHVRRLGLKPRHKSKARDDADSPFALKDGHWFTDHRGIARWVP